MRLIDADALCENIWKYAAHYTDRDGYVMVRRGEIASMIDTAPTIDAVPVVRCGECMHHEDEEPGMVYCPHQIGGWMPVGWFCAMGERKDGDKHGS